MTEPVWIETQDALLLHARLLALYGGAAGLRDEGLLKSALARPHQLYAYAEEPSIIEMATAYTAGIVGNYPFVDGNKRTAIASAAYLLSTFGYEVDAEQNELADFAVNVAEGTFELADISLWFEKHSRKG